MPHTVAELGNTELPGGDVVALGLADLDQGVESVPALLVSIGAPRLQALGLVVARPLPDPERRLYQLLARQDPDAAHSRYNAFVRRLVSFERALACRALADASRIRRFMEALGAVAHRDARGYFTGGATAVLSGWRDTTIAVDVKLVPEYDVLLAAIPRLKESLALNVEFASPLDFIPVMQDWQDRSLYVVRYGPLSFFHFDLYAQALAKLERGDVQDLADVRAMLERGLIEAPRALRYFDAIEPQLFRYPAVDPGTFRRAVQTAFAAP